MLTLSKTVEGISSTALIETGGDDCKAVVGFSWNIAYQIGPIVSIVMSQ